MGKASNPPDVVARPCRTVVLLPAIVAYLRGPAEGESAAGRPAPPCRPGAADIKPKSAP